MQYETLERRLPSVEIDPAADNLRIYRLTEPVINHVKEFGKFTATDFDGPLRQSYETRTYSDDGTPPIRAIGIFLKRQCKSYTLTRETRFNYPSSGTVRENGPVMSHFRSI